MADDQDASNEINEGEDAPEQIDDYDVPISSSTTFIGDNNVAPLSDDYDDDDAPIEDYVVNLVVNEQPDGGVISSDFVDTAVTDIHGRIISSNSSLIDSFNGYTTAVYDELNGNGTDLYGGKRWWGWSTKKLIFAGLIALCILGVILAIVFLVIGKKFKKNKRSPATGPTTTTKTVVTKTAAPDSKYQPVPNV